MIQGEQYRTRKLKVLGIQLGNLRLSWSLLKSVITSVSQSVQSPSRVWLFVTPEPQHARCPGVYPNPCPLSRWCHPTISSSVVPFSSCPQSFPATGSFPMSWLFTLGSQRIGVSASVSVLPMNIQDWFPLGLTVISLQSKGLSRVFSNTTIWKPITYMP